MSGAFDLRVMGLLLRQGRRLHGVSLLLLAIAAAWLVWAVVSPAGTLGLVDGAALWLSVVAAVAQLYHALRVDLDADLLLALADQPAPGTDGDADPGLGHEAAAALLDDSLQALGLLGSKRRDRDWATRWQAVRRFFFRQSTCLALQAGLLVLAWVAVFVRSHG